MFNGFHSVPFSLNDNVIMVLLGTGTTNVIGPAVLFAKYLF